MSDLDIFMAIKDNKLSKLKQYVEEIPSIFSDGVTPLGFATRCNHIPIIRWLAGCGVADINKPDSNGSTPLMIACRENLPKAAQELLRHNPNLNLTNQKEHTALHIACIEGHQALVKTLLATTAAPNTQDIAGQTPLISAVMAEDKACVKLLLARHAVNLSGTAIQDVTGNTALMWAVVKENAEVAKLLLDNGADPNIKSNNGLTPLMVAASKGNAKIARLLLKHNADFTAKGPKGIAIDIALRHGHKAVASAIRQGVTRAWPTLGLTGVTRGLTGVTKVTKAKKGPAKVSTARGPGFLQDDGDIWVKGKGIYKPNGDFYADIPYFD